MYRVEKRVTVPFGHRLSKHDGRCSSIHGHNMVILVGIKSSMLNSNDMVIDFSKLKSMITEIVDEWDHCLLLNEVDDIYSKTWEDVGTRCIKFPFDPTAEKLTEVLFNTLTDKFFIHMENVCVDYVTIYENENSKATYMLG